MTNHEIWQTVLADFELKVSKANFTTWFRSTGISQFNTDGEVFIAVPNTFTKTWLERKYHTEIVKILEKVTGQRIKKIEYKVENIKNLQELECSFTEVKISNIILNNNNTSDGHRLTSQFGLNPKHTFNTFVVGKGNELAHAAAKAVADRPGSAYNPLFIYGNTGHGKTHLIQAIGNHFKKQYPGRKVFYLTSEKFANEYVSSIQNKTTNSFKEKYRKYNLLIVDDIQFFSDKLKIQEEFFHVFNSLYESGNQIVFSSDKSPQHIVGLEERLRSRFEGGMIADVSLPDYETRLVIL